MTIPTVPDWLRDALIREGWTPPENKVPTRPAEVFTGSGRWIQPRRLDQIMSVRLSTEQIAFLRDKANAVGCSPSDVVREAIQAISPTTLFINGRRIS